MSGTNKLVQSVFQPKSESALTKALDNANEVAAQNNKPKKQAPKKK